MAELHVVLLHEKKHFKTLTEDFDWDEECKPEEDTPPKSNIAARDVNPLG